MSTLNSVQKSLTAQKISEGILKTCPFGSTGIFFYLYTIFPPVFLLSDLTRVVSLGAGKPGLPLVSVLIKAVCTWRSWGARIPNDGLRS